MKFNPSDVAEAPFVLDFVEQATYLGEASHTGRLSLHSIHGPSGGGCLMRRTPRFVVLALPLLLLVAARWLHPASVQPTPGLRPTIEPTLPLTLDLRALPADPARGEPP